MPARVQDAMFELPFHGKTYGGCGIRAGLNEGNALKRVEQFAASRSAGLV
jgi:hypothetical protein